MIIGIDPGLTGGYCLLNKDGKVESLGNHSLSDGWIHYRLMFIEYFKLSEKYNKSELILTYIEKPFILSSQQGNEKIWRNYQTLILAFNYPTEIRAQDWKKGLKIPKGLSKKDAIQWQYENLCPKKNINWYKTTKTGKPSKTLNDGLIDAYCIALYAQNINNS